MTFGSTKVVPNIMNPAVIVDKREMIRPQRREVSGRGWAYEDMTFNADQSTPDALAPQRSGQLTFLTVEEAARVLRIGRTAAYLLAKRWEHTNGADGLPVVRFGRLMRVPVHELERLAGGTIDTTADVTEPRSGVADLTVPPTAIEVDAPDDQDTGGDHRQTLHTVPASNGRANTDSRRDQARQTTDGTQGTLFPEAS